MIMRFILPIIAVVALSACSRTEDEAKSADGAPAAIEELHQADKITVLSASDLPEAVAAVVRETVPGITIVEAERKDRDRRTYYDVEGVRPNGAAVELDVLGENGTFKVVEIQRDIEWADVPTSIRAASDAANPVTPVRVIESTQADQSVIYELFAKGKSDKPAREVRLKDGKAEVLTEAWPH